MFSFLSKIFNTKIVEEPSHEEVANQEPESFLFKSRGLMPSQREALLKKTFQKKMSDFPHESITQDSGADTAMALDASIHQQFSSGQQGMPDILLTWYANQGFIGYQACAMIAQNWLVDKACSLPGQDAVRNGYTVTSNNGQEIDAEIIDAIRIADKRFKITQQMESFVRFGRIFGVRHALFLVDSDDPKYYEKPFNPDGVGAGKYRGISQVDPYWITPELDAAAAADPASPHFYEPTFWRISGKRYHRSHFIIMRNGEVPDVLKPSYFYGGMPVAQRIYERVYAAERTANEGPELLLTKRMTVLHTDMEKVMMNQERFEQAMQQWIYYRDNYGVKVVGEEEVIEQFDTTLTDMDVSIMTQYQLVAAIADVPATKLLGTSPKGFNATGEYEESGYHETLESIQTHFAGPLLERHHICLIRSEIAPNFGIEPMDTTVEWEPLDTPTAKELAETNFIKSQTAQNYVAAGAIDGMDIRTQITADPSSGFSGLAEIEPGDLMNGQEDAPAITDTGKE